MEEKPIINADLVRHVAALVRIELSDEEVERFAGQFAAIIEYFSVLNELDVSEILPANQESGRHNVMRPDEAQPGLALEEFMGNVPRRQGDQVLTLATIAPEE